jgi:hypothetical protein
MFDLGQIQILKYSTILLALIVGATYYAKTFTHLLSPAAVCQEDQFCGAKLDPATGGPPGEHLNFPRQENGFAHQQYFNSHPSEPEYH